MEPSPILMPDAPSISLRRQLTPEEWAAFRPIIERLYMHQNKTFKQVATILRNEYNFEPT